MTTNTELIARLRSFEVDHKPEGWPAIQMRDVSALLDAIEALEAQAETLRYELDAVAAIRAERDALQAQLAAARETETKYDEALCTVAAQRDAYKDQLAAAHGVPERWKLVPIEPTTEMLDAPPNSWPADAKVTWKAMIAAAQQAQPEPSEKTWCEYVAGMVGCYLGEPVDSDKCKAIAAIIERRLWALPKPAQQAQPEPVNQVLLKALSALLTHSGMDEDEWSKPTFDQARAAIKLATTKTQECGMCGYVGTEVDVIGQCPRCHWDELQAQPERAPLSDVQKLDIVTNWFTNDDDITRAMQILTDYDQTSAIKQGGQHD